MFGSVNFTGLYNSGVPYNNVVRSVKTGSLPENRNKLIVVKEGKKQKKSLSDKMKIGAYILGGLTLLGGIIYCCCAKKFTPNAANNIDNTIIASENSFIIGDIIDQIA